MLDPPTAAASTSSGISRASTVFVAWRNEERMISPSPRGCRRDRRGRSDSACLVVNPLKIEAPGRGGGPGFVTWTPFEQTLEGRRIHFQHRTDQGSDHVSQEAVGGDPEL